MSTTLERETAVRAQVNDLLRCFQHICIYDMQDEASVSMRCAATKTRINVTRTMNIVADNEATPLIKNQLKLVPAKLDLSFITSIAGATGDNVSCSYALDSNVINKIGEYIETNKSAKVIAAWSESKREGWSYLNDDLENATFVSLNLTESWKVYRVTDEYSDMCYVHFPIRDSWLAFRFYNLSSDSVALQIMSEHEGFVMDCKMKWRDGLAEFPPASEGSGDNCLMQTHAVTPPLVNNYLFDLGALTDMADELIENFKGDQEDAYIDPEELETAPLNFICGSETDLENLVTLICHAGIPLPIWDHLDEELQIIINSAMEDDDTASVNYENMGYYGWEKLHDLLTFKIPYFEQAFDAAIDQNQPYGYSWEYNDGPYDRQSGYDRNPCQINVNVCRPSAHEQICAKMEIKKLTHIMSKTVIDGLLS